MTQAQVRERFVSLLKISDKGFRSLRAKMNFTGSNGVQCWDSDKQKRDLPEDWLNCSVNPIFRIKGLWLMSRDWGILCEWNMPRYLRLQRPAPSRTNSILEQTFVFSSIPFAMPLLGRVEDFRRQICLLKSSAHHAPSRPNSRTERN